MSDGVIQVEKLSKSYQIGGKKKREDTLRDSLTHAFSAPFSVLRRNGKSTSSEQTIWALKDVSFEVKQGDALGIIGRNGAGKSTLLKILSRITDPTEGHVRIHGRVASLLEVGTGFHQELTGRENIYLNGTIIGMKRAEIKRKFDEIVAFAEIDKFVDTPVKHYSSGMYVRLAFAVAAHLEPEILIVDEVLAVGDAEFQKKCLGKMRDVAGEGRTIIFVSHNMAAVRQICSRGIVLDGGQIEFFGAVGESISIYAANSEDRSGKIIDHLKVKDRAIQVLQVTVNASESDKIELSNNNFKIEIVVQLSLQAARRISILCVLADKSRQPIGMATPGQFKPDDSLFRLSAGLYEIASTIHLPLLNKGTYFLYLSIIDPGIEAYAEFLDAVELDVEGFTSATGVVLHQELHGYLYLDADAKQRKLLHEAEHSS